MMIENMLAASGGEAVILKSVNFLAPSCPNEIVPAMRAGAKKATAIFF